MASSCCFIGADSCMVPSSWRRRALERAQEEFEENVNFLSTVPLFLKQVPKGDIPKVARRLHQRRYAQGETICKQGSKPHPREAFFIIRDGEVLITHEDEDHHVEVRTRLSVGDYFGGTTLLDGGPYAISAIGGAGQATLLTLSIQDFDELGFRKTLQLPKRQAMYEGRKKGGANELCPTFHAGEPVQDDEAVEFIVKNLRRNSNIRSLVPLKEDSLLQVARCARKVVVERGKHLYQVGDPAPDIFIIESGKVDLLPPSRGRILTSGSRSGSRMGFEKNIPLPVMERRHRKTVFMRQMLNSATAFTGDSSNEEESDESDEDDATRGMKTKTKRLTFSRQKSVNFQAIRSKSKDSVQAKRRNSYVDIGSQPFFRTGQWVKKRAQNTAVLRKANNAMRMPAFANEEPEIGRVVCVMPNGMVSVDFPMEGLVKCRGDELQKTTRPTSTVELGRGDVFGEVAVLYNTRRLTSAVVSEQDDAVMYVVSRKDFKGSLKQNGINLEAWVELLKSVTSIGGLITSECRELAKNATAEVVFEPNEVVMEEGRQTPQEWYVIMSGTAILSTADQETPTGLKKTVLHRGCHFGESAILAGKTDADCSVYAGDMGMVCLTFDGDIVKNIAKTADFSGTPGDSSYVERMAKTTRKSLSYMVDPDKLETICKLGSGNFSTVYLQEDLISGQKYALKRTSKRRVRVTGMEKQTCNERDILSLVSSDFVTQLHCTFQDDTFVYMLQEVALGGSLEDLVDKHPNGMSFEHARFYAACVAFGLEHLHERRIAHRDLKPANVLVNEQGWPKICDLGFARFVLKKTYTMLGTPVYMAPELLDFPNEHDHMVDWWALGVMTFEFLMGKVPWCDSSADDDHRCVMVRELQRNNPHPPLREGTPAAADAFVRRLLVAEPRRRMGSSNLATEHAWFSEAENFQREDLLNQLMQPPNIPDDFMPADEDIIEGGLDTHDDDQSFKLYHEDEWQSEGLCIEDGLFRKVCGAARGFDASARTKTAGVLRITGHSTGVSAGMIRFGLTTDPDDDHDFNSGYWVGISPHLVGARKEAKKYICGGEERITLAVDEGTVDVFVDDVKVHSMDDGKSYHGGPLYGKVFIHQHDGAIEVSAYQDPPNEDKTWAAAFKLPEAVTKLHRLTSNNHLPGTPSSGGDFRRSSSLLEFRRASSQGLSTPSSPSAGFPGSPKAMMMNKQGSRGSRRGFFEATPTVVEEDAASASEPEDHLPIPKGRWAPGRKAPSSGELLEKVGSGGVYTPSTAASTAASMSDLSVPDGLPREDSRGLVDARAGVAGDGEGVAPRALLVPPPRAPMTDVDARCGVSGSLRRNAYTSGRQRTA